MTQMHKDGARKAALDAISKLPKWSAISELMGREIGAHGVLAVAAIFFRLRPESEDDGGPQIESALEIFANSPKLAEDISAALVPFTGGVPGTERETMKHVNNPEQ